MKKVLPIILALLIGLSVVQTAAYSTENYKNGDVDRNATVNVSDATLVQKSISEIVHLTPEQERLADVDMNQSIDIKDATMIQKVVSEIETMPQEPTTTQPTTSAPTTEPTTQPTTVAPETQPTTAPDPVISNNLKIYFSNNKNWSNVYFYLYNSQTGAQYAAWPGKKITSYTTNNFGEKIYNSVVDVSTYNRIIFTNNAGQQTVNIPLNKASSGFYIASGSGSSMLPGTYAYNGADSGKIVTTTLNYSTGYNKKIWIWTPADYSADSAKKFKTVYIMDGQNLFDADHSDSFGGWQVTDAVESMMSNGGRGMIIVGIDNGNAKRDSELTPDIGEVKPQYKNEFSSRTGKTFSDFVVNKVMPYVQSKYNSSTAASDNAIVGSSSGGLEAFYIGMEHTDKFSHIGALSPAFALFNTTTWNSYLSKYNTSSADMPRLYIYNGKGDGIEQELYQDTCNMYTRLTNNGYSKDKITLVLEENACHNEAYWRIIFPEMLSWCYQW